MIFNGLKSNSYLNYLSGRRCVKLPIPFFVNINVIQIITKFLLVGKITLKDQLLRVNSLKIILKKDIVIVAIF